DGQAEPTPDARRGPRGLAPAAAVCRRLHPHPRRRGLARVRDGPARSARPRRPRLPAPSRRPDPRAARDGPQAVLIPAASVAPVTAAPPPPGFPDADSETWIAVLGGTPGATRDAAVARLHALLLRAARFELRRRGTRVDVDDLAIQAADDALLAIL